MLVEGAAPSSPKSCPKSPSWADTVKHLGPPQTVTPSPLAKLSSRHSDRSLAPKKTPEQINAKLLRAEESRQSTLTTKVKKARVSAERVRSVTERMVQIEQTKQQQRQSLIELNQKKADALREQQNQLKKTRAETESKKVKENRSTSKSTTTPAQKKQEMEERLQEAENRRRAQEEEKRRISQELANPRSITQEDRFKRICKHCNAEIRSSEPISTHLISKRHLAALSAFGINLDPSLGSSLPSIAENCVLKVPLFPVVHSPPTEEEISDTKLRQDVSKRRAKKVKQKLSALALQLTAQSPKSSVATQSATKTSHSVLTTQIQRLLVEMKDQLTKRHTSLLESTLLKLHKVILTRPGAAGHGTLISSSSETAGRVVIELKGAPVLLSILATYTATSGLGVYVTTDFICF